MFFYFYNYNLLNIFFNWTFYFISLLLVLLLFVISFFSVKKAPNIEKLSVYECGFQPFDHNNNTFDIKFYLIAILFIVFDLELLFLLPWVFCVYYLSIVSLIGVLYFVFILTFGFVYEWFKGALLWN